ncbi:MAG: TIGR04086 family membrane protein [Clostridia bacterium]|nr:TIGR04086 family membrane protein [Clostridia bacterium]
MKAKRIWLVFIKGIALGFGITLLLTALLALVAKGGAEDRTVSLLALLFKGAGILAGVGYVCRGVRKNGALCGLITGVTFWGLCFALSCLLFGGAFSVTVLADFASCAAVAVFAGVLFTNLLR